MEGEDGEGALPRLGNRSTSAKGYTRFVSLPVGPRRTDALNLLQANANEDSVSAVRGASREGRDRARGLTPMPWILRWSVEGTEEPTARCHSSPPYKALWER